ncbi:MAG: hypothetical protein CM15mP38_0580 [Synechococcus sp.]|nr:MAG: hypothetical protein CM15mP38_0580 [Synechococcus sp.]
MSQTLSSLARLTLRQLRQIASDLGVPLYSRKSKETLVDEVAQRQQKRGGDLRPSRRTQRPAMGSSDTRVVFLPVIPSGPTCSGKFRRRSEGGPERWRQPALPAPG